MFGTISGKRTGKRVSSLGTSAQTLISAKDKMTVTLESAALCNRTANALTVSLYIDGGGSQTYIYNEFSLAAHTTAFLTNHSMPIVTGQSYKVVASGTGIDVTAVFIESNQNQAPTGSL